MSDSPGRGNGPTSRGSNPDLSMLASNLSSSTLQDSSVSSSSQPRGADGATQIHLQVKLLKCFKAKFDDDEEASPEIKDVMMFGSQYILVTDKSNNKSLKLFSITGEQITKLKFQKQPQRIAVFESEESQEWNIAVTESKAPTIHLIKFSNDNFTKPPKTITSNKQCNAITAIHNEFYVGYQNVPSIDKFNFNGTKTIVFSVNIHPKTLASSISRHTIICIDKGNSDLIAWDANTGNELYRKTVILEGMKPVDVCYMEDKLVVAYKKSVHLWDNDCNHIQKLWAPVMENDFLVALSYNHDIGKCVCVTKLGTVNVLEITF